MADASLVLRLLLPGPGAVTAREALRAQDLHVPHLMDLEMASVLRRVSGHAVPEPVAEQALADLGSLPLMRYPHLPLLPRVWQLRHNVTAYDAAYVALAELLDCPLATCDRRLSRANGLRCEVRVLG